MKLSYQILLGFLAVILFSIADSYTNFRLSTKVQRNTEFLSRSENVIRHSNQIHRGIIQMQSAFRGYLLTTDTAFLDYYYEGLQSVPLLLGEQRELITDNPSQIKILDTIQRMHAEWIIYSNQLINSHKGSPLSGPSDYIDLFNNKLKKHVGKNLNDLITAKFLDFDRSEYRIRNIRSRNLITSIERTHTFSILFITLTIVIGLTSAIFIVTMISKRIKSMVNLAQDISNGRFTTVKDTRNDELTGLSSSLNSMSDRLSKTIRELKKRNEELNKFAYVVSHDLKAPVRGIHNVVKWIEEDLKGEISPAMKKYLDLIPQRTKRMEDLINGLLEYARLNEKSVPEEVDTNSLVKDICDVIIPRHFTVEINPLPKVKAERLKLEQVFANLISNSVKYIMHNKGHIVISAEDAGDRYYFSVKDNGIGIDEEYHKKIFEIFQTLREKNEKESTGVGLAIVKKIIDEQHGSVRVVSRVGQGAEFIFSWPKI